MLFGLYDLIGPIRFWVIVVSLFYLIIYGANLYFAATRRAREFRARGMRMNAQVCVDKEFSSRLSRGEPLILLYVAAFVIFLGSFVTLIISQ